MAKPCGRKDLFVLIKAPLSPLTLQESVALIIPTLPIGIMKLFHFCFWVFITKLELQIQSGLPTLCIFLKQPGNCFLWSDWLLLICGRAGVKHQGVYKVPSMYLLWHLSVLCPRHLRELHSCNTLWMLCDPCEPAKEGRMNSWEAKAEAGEVAQEHIHTAPELLRLQHTQEGFTTREAPALRDLMPSSGLLGTCTHMCMYTQTCACIHKWK